MLATRRQLDPLDEPTYDVGSVARCARAADGLPSPESSYVEAAGSSDEERGKWIKAIPEFLLLCNAAAKEAASRSHSRAKQVSRVDGASKGGSRRGDGDAKGSGSALALSTSATSTSTATATSVTPIPPPAPLPEQFGGKPLAIEYLADRLDVDDPMHGYVVRERGTGHIQGFITLTTFTTWCRFFRW